MDYRIYDLEIAIKNAEIREEISGNIQAINLLPLEAKWYLEQAKRMDELKLMVEADFHSDEEILEKVKGYFK